ncbi:hypothetical protein [Streptomyces sp. 4N124]|uniref:hypothetical protein n=1 Tax=Streptomyces sp. 4N124 TaxID=3457420 RepID=UPI003FD3CC0A
MANHAMGRALRGLDASARLQQDVLSLHGVKGVLYYYDTNDLAAGCDATQIPHSCGGACDGFLPFDHVLKDPVKPNIMNAVVQRFSQVRGLPTERGSAKSQHRCQ